MTQELWIRTSASDEHQFDYMVVEDHSKTYSMQVQDVVALLSKTPHAYSDIIFFVPTQNCLLTTVTIPELSKRNRQSVLGFALEGIFLEDLEKQHIAILGEANPGDYAVAAIHHKEMQYFTEALELLDIKPTMVLPDIFALPFEDSEHQVVISDNKVRLRTGVYTGFSVLPENARFYLEKIIKAAPEKPIKVYHGNEDLNPGLSRFLQEHSASFHALPELKQWLENIRSVWPKQSLLQGSYKPKRSRSPVQSAWRWCAISFAAYIVLVAALWLGEYAYYSYQVTAADQALAELSQSIFKTEKSKPLARKEIVKLLKKVSISVRDKGFLALASRSGQAIKKSKAEIVKLEYKNGKLVYTLQADSASTLRDLSTLLNKRKLKVSQDKVEQSGGVARSVMRVSAR